MHNYKQAYSDLQEYLTRFTTANDASRVRQAAALRADLLNAPHLPGLAERSPLRLLTFQRLGERHDQ